jgi:hypothetical protein
MGLVHLLSRTHPSLRWLVAMAPFLVSACGDADDTGGGGSGGHGSTGSTGSGAPAPDCAERCAAKAGECGAPPDVAANACGQLCGMSLTEAQMTCLEAKSCNELADAFGGGSTSICGIGDGSSTTGPGMTTASGPSYLHLGDACNCGGGADLCQSTDGPCSPELTCVLRQCAGDPCEQANSDCPSGTNCTEFIKDGISLGSFCAVH